jgi:hypothetical protein
MTASRPVLLTFDVFGTILDWRLGTLQAVARAGGALPEVRFDEVVDAQGRLERAGEAGLVVPDLAALADLVERV